MKPILVFVVGVFLPSCALPPTQLPKQELPRQELPAPEPRAEIQPRASALTPGMVVTNIQKGKTTQSEIMEIFGPPDMVTTLTLMGTADATQERNTVVSKAGASLSEQPVETKIMNEGDVSKAKDRVVYSSLPLYFEANQGQVDKQVKFVSRGSGYILFLTSDEAVVVLNKPDEQSAVTHDSFAKTEETNSKIKTPPLQVQDVLRMKLVGGNLASQMTGLDPLHGKTNYLIGKDAKQWHTNVPTYAKVQYNDVYPGIDLIYHGNQRQLEYDFIVAPGNDPNIITLSFDGAKRLSINESGELIIDLEKGAVQQKRPFIYQEIAGVKKEISGGYVLKDNNQVGFQVASYDVTKRLIIDPVLVNSTYLGGGGGDQGTAIAVDSQGNAYVTGSTFSPNFPTTLNAYNPSRNGLFDVFVTKLNPKGSALVYSTYLGGSVSVEGGTAIAVDSQGNAYVTGFTGASDFPTTPDAFDTFHNGNNDVFVTKLNPDGSALLYSTYLGGTGFDQGNAIAVDSQGNAYVIGGAGLPDFPTTPGAFDTSFDYFDIFVTKLNPGGTALVYSTALGTGNIEGGTAIAVDSQGNAYVTGWTVASNFPTTPGAFDTDFNGVGDAFVTKFNPNGSALVYSTFLGGTGNDRGHGIAVDSQGNAYVTGLTNSSDFPTTEGAFDRNNGGNADAFVTKLNPNASALIYSTYLGGNGSDQGNAIAVDSSGNAYVTGDTSSSNFPTTPDAIDRSLGGVQNAFVAKLNAGGSALADSTYLGGTNGDHGSGIAVDLAGNAYATGETN